MSCSVNQCPWWGTGGDWDHDRWGRRGSLYLPNAIHRHHHKIFFALRWAALASPAVAGKVFRGCLSARAVIASLSVGTCPVLPGFPFHSQYMSCVTRLFFPQSVHVLCYQTFLFTVSTCPVLPDFSFHSQYMSCVTRLCPSSTTCNSFSQSIGSCINCCLSVTTDVTVSTFLHYPTSINHNWLLFTVIPFLCYLMSIKHNLPLHRQYIPILPNVCQSQLTSFHSLQVPA